MNATEHSLARRLHDAAISADPESPRVLDFVQRGLALAGGGSVLDVGCGYGRYMRLLQARGVAVTGIDAGTDIVAANRAAGLNCCSPDELFKGNLRVQTILMSHVIEHLTPNDLFAFLDRLLDRLDDGGFLVIATPLEGPHFWDDFDHVKPYHVDGLLMVYGSGAQQVQYRSHHRLELVDIAFPRTPWRVTHARARYLRSPMTRLVQVANVLAALAWRASGGLIGRKSRWIGLFRKTTPSK